MKVLITGASGFIGSYLLKEAKKNPDYTEIYTAGRKPVSIEPHTKHKSHYFIDLARQSEVEQLFTYINPCIIFHLAGYPLVKVNPRNINEAFDANIQTTHNLLHFCKQGCKFVLASTVIVHGDLSDIEYRHCGFTTPLSEYDITIPTSIYGISKLSAEMLIKIYTSRNTINGVIARMCANVGDSATHGVLKDFITKAKNDNEYFEILGDKPGSTKPYMYVIDTVSALMMLAKQNNCICNICPNDNINTETIAQIVQEECGINKPIKWLGEQANWIGDNRILSISNAKLLSLGFKPIFSTSAEAIRNVVRNSI